MAFDLYDFIESDPTEGGSNDTVNLWITQSIVDNTYTGSFVQGLTIPRISVNGNLDTILLETKELVFQFPSGSTSIYRNAFVDTRKFFKNYYYLKLKQNVLIPSGSLAFNFSSDFFNIGFVPENESKFKFSDYDIDSFQISSIRRSDKHLIVDRTKSSPRTGRFTGNIVPDNFEILSASFLDNNLENIPQRLFSETQESNYNVTFWTNGRYKGTKENNNGDLGREPALSFESFQGIFFSSASSDITIRNLITGSLADLETDTTFFTVVGSIPNSDKRASFNFYQSGSNTGTELPYSSILELKNENLFNIYLYRQKEDRSNEFARIANSKIVDKETSRILKTDLEGKVVSISI